MHKNVLWTFYIVNQPNLTVQCHGYRLTFGCLRTSGDEFSLEYSRSLH